LREAEEAEVFRKLERVLAATVVKLDDVEPPNRDRGAYREMVSAYRRGVATTSTLADALQSGNRRAIATAASEYTTAIGEAQAKARDLGLAECNRFGLPAGN
jgi:hypothetical protein